VTGLAASAIFAILFFLAAVIWWDITEDAFLLILILVSAFLFIVTWGIRLFKKDRRDRAKENSKVKKRDVKRVDEDEERSEEEEDRERRRVRRIREEDIEYIPSYRERARYYDEDYSDLDRKYKLEGSANHPSLGGGSGKYLGSLNGQVEEEKPYLNSGGGLMQRSESEEEPMIFRTRMAEDILIFEYSDRLELYRENSGGSMELIEIRRK